MIDNRLKNTVLSMKRDRKQVEATVIGGVICPLCRLKGYSVYIYGQKYAEGIISYLYYNDIVPSGIITNDIGLVKSTFDIEEIREEDISTSIPNKWAAMVIITETPSEKCIARLTQAGIDKYYSVTDEEIYMMTGGRSAWIRYYRNNIDDLNSVFEVLDDEESKSVMLEFIRAMVECGNYKNPHIDGRFKYFFDVDNKGIKHDIYEKKKDEVWLNCGANVGDTIFLYKDNNLTAKKIYAFEGDEETYRALVNNIKWLPDDIKNNVIAEKKYIDDKTDLRGYISEKITLINADIEGGETKLLKAIEDIIIEDRPVVAICVYHLPSDIVKIPQFFKNIHDYHIKLRKYEADIRNINRTSEVVLYAIPTDRLIM